MILRYQRASGQLVPTSWLAAKNKIFLRHRTQKDSYSLAFKEKIRQYKTTASAGIGTTAEFCPAKEDKKHWPAFDL